MHIYAFSFQESPAAGYKKSAGVYLRFHMLSTNADRFIGSINSLRISLIVGRGIVSHHAPALRLFCMPMLRQ